ncbi:hypothetical protein EDD17DRAFT_1514891 [Pisolithus thermaeus]|nr:hypothetical protein EDD17DRAFT_1514891 [Pisolithus thermaeus]
MFFSWFSSQEESYPLASLNHNGNSSEEHNNSLSLTNTTNTDNPRNEHNPSSSLTTLMNIDNPWNATDAHTSTALPKEAAKNKAPENTAIVIRSIGSSLGKCSTSVGALKMDENPVFHLIFQPALAEGGPKGVGLLI